MNVSELHMYDLYVPLTEDYEKTYTYKGGAGADLKGAEAVRRGSIWISPENRICRNRWIDVYENGEKKRRVLQQRLRRSARMC